VGGDASSFLVAALPGTEMPSGSRRDGLLAQLRSAWRIWVAKSGHEFAIFVSKGKHLSPVVQADIRAANAIGVHAVVIATEYQDIQGLAPHYVTLRPYLIAEIADAPVLIPPLKTKRRHLIHTAPRTRVPLPLLTTLRGSSRLPAFIQRALKRLHETYKRLNAGRANNDDREEAALMRYATDILDAMGLKAEGIRRTRMIRMLEGGGHGARRDHFFHSFQNYFLGMTAIETLPSWFEKYSQEGKLFWNISPYDVWFLTAMWHDVGYALQNAGRTAEWALGVDLGDTSAATIKREYLDHPVTKEALQRVSSLMARLLKPPRSASAWMMPDAKTHLGAHGLAVRAALEANAVYSHGAIGALHLYRGYKDDLDEMVEPSKRDALLQSVLIAAASMPFHDYFFRKDMRKACGECVMSTACLPFAALLAFIDSIQEDRRDLDGPGVEALVLEGLHVADPACIVADLNQAALRNDQVLDKILEARDVFAALRQPAGGMTFHYPEWIGCDL
jgi:hypothetical protein